MCMMCAEGMFFVYILSYIGAFLQQMIASFLYTLQLHMTGVCYKVTCHLMICNATLT